MAKKGREITTIAKDGGDDNPVVSRNYGSAAAVEKAFLQGLRAPREFDEETESLMALALAKTNLAGTAATVRAQAEAGIALDAIDAAANNKARINELEKDATGKVIIGAHKVGLNIGAQVIKGLYPES